MNNLLFRFKKARLFHVGMVLISLFTGTQVAAQTSASSNTHHQLTGVQAMQIAQAAFQYALTQDRQVTVTVVDDKGRSMVMLRHENATGPSFQNSYKKAYTANLEKMDTSTLGLRLAQDRRISDLSLFDDRVLIVDGGVPIHSGGQVIGAIGVGGRDNFEDDAIARYGIQSVFGSHPNLSHAAHSGVNQQRYFNRQIQEFDMHQSYLRQQQRNQQLQALEQRRLNAKGGKDSLPVEPRQVYSNIRER